jgi:hypothetical protein
MVQMWEARQLFWTTPVAANQGMVWLCDLKPGGASLFTFMDLEGF